MNSWNPLAWLHMLRCCNGLKCSSKRSTQADRALMWLESFEMPLFCGFHPAPASRSLHKITVYVRKTQYHKCCSSANKQCCPYSHILVIIHCSAHSGRSLHTALVELALSNWFCSAMVHAHTIVRAAHLISQTNTGAVSVRLLITYCIRMSSQLRPFATYSRSSFETESV